MPRRARLHVAGGSYHVTLRGNHQHAIFARTSDRDRLDDIVAEAAQRFQAIPRAYCWMSNHLHLLVEVSDIPLGRLMQRVATRYARYFQGSFGITGHLFERRYHALLVDRDSYLLELVRYIHLNPVRAGIVGCAADYRWSSHRAYLGSSEPRWVNPAKVLGMFGDDPGDARVAYERFVAAGAERGVILPVDTGATCDARVFAVPPAPALAPRIDASLDALIERICVEAHCSRHEIASASRKRVLVHARARIAEEAIALGLASITEVARNLGRTPAGISWILHHRRP